MRGLASLGLMAAVASLGTMELMKPDPQTGPGRKENTRPAGKPNMPEVETRQIRRARERAEAKAAKKAGRDARNQS